MGQCGGLSQRGCQNYHWSLITTRLLCSTKICTWVLGSSLIEPQIWPPGVQLLISGHLLPLVTSGQVVQEMRGGGVIHLSCTFRLPRVGSTATSNFDKHCVGQDHIEPSQPSSETMILTMPGKQRFQHSLVSLHIPLITNTSSHLQHLVMELNSSSVCSWLSGMFNSSCLWHTSSHHHPLDQCEIKFSFL